MDDRCEVRAKLRPEHKPASGRCTRQGPSSVTATSPWWGTRGTITRPQRRLPPPRALDPQQTLYVTESPRKADAAMWFGVAAGTASGVVRELRARGATGWTDPAPTARRKSRRDARVDRRDDERVDRAAAVCDAADGALGGDPERLAHRAADGDAADAIDAVAGRALGGRRARVAQRLDRRAQACHAVRSRWGAFGVARARPAQGQSGLGFKRRLSVRGCRLRDSRVGRRVARRCSVPCHRRPRGTRRQSSPRLVPLRSSCYGETAGDES